MDETFDFTVQTINGDTDPAWFLEELSDNIWPTHADMVESVLTSDYTCDLSVTYVIEPFWIEKTICYAIRVFPDKLHVSALGDIPFDDSPVDIEELARVVDSRIYEDFREECSW